MGERGIASPHVRFHYVVMRKRGKHRRVRAHLFGFQPCRLNRCPGGDKQRGYLALLPLVSGRRVVPAMDSPSQRRRMVLVILEVDIRALDQPFGKSIFAKKSSPMEGGFSKESA